MMCFNPQLASSGHVPDDMNLPARRGLLHLKPLDVMHSIFQANAVPYRLTALLMFVLALGAGGCAETSRTVQVPARILYFEGETLVDTGLPAEAITKFQTVIDENPGTRLATFAHLKIGDAQSLGGNWREADTAYRLFLLSNPNSPLTPYVLYRLLIVNHEQSFTGTIFREREFDRDMAPNRRIILEYKRFSLLYPDSVYRDEIQPIYHSARRTLADHEQMVGDFYADRSQYNAAAYRYEYLLRHYPEYPETREVVRKLFDAFRANQQPRAAEEMSRVLESLADEAVAATPALAQRSGAASANSDE
jgi:outer membrane assembly lipoprotein YfiO